VEAAGDKINRKCQIFIINCIFGTQELKVIRAPLPALFRNWKDQDQDQDKNSRINPNRIIKESHNVDMRTSQKN
jgi:hypothetical protein